MTLEKIGAFLGIVTSLIAIWQFVASTTDQLGRGPVAIAKDIGEGSDGVVLTVPTTTGDQLAAPSGVSISGDCQSGFTLTWEPVQGAERYRVEEDGVFKGTETNTDHSIPANPDGKEHRYTVFADALLHPRSDASEEVVAGPCSFTESGG